MLTVLGTKQLAFGVQLGITLNTYAGLCLPLLIYYAF
jgi:hypothetical protein